MLRHTALLPHTTPGCVDRVALSAQVDRLIEVQPSQAQALNSQLPPGFMYVPAACLPANDQVALQLATPAAPHAAVPAADMPLPHPAGPLTLAAADGAGPSTDAVRAGSLAQETTPPGLGAGAPPAVASVAAPQHTGVLPGVSAIAAEPPASGAVPTAAVPGAGRSTPEMIDVDEDYEPLAALAGSRARGPRDKTPRRPRTSDMARPGTRVGMRAKRGQ